MKDSGGKLEPYDIFIMFFSTGAGIVLSQVFDQHLFALGGILTGIVYGTYKWFR